MIFFFLSVNFCLWVVCQSVVCRWVVVLPFFFLYRFISPSRWWRWEYYYYYLLLVLLLLEPKAGAQSINNGNNIQRLTWSPNCQIIVEDVYLTQRWDCTYSKTDPVLGQLIDIILPWHLSISIKGYTKRDHKTVKKIGFNNECWCH